MNPPARLIALEGIDGCGKSTQATRLARRIDALLTREPGGTDLGRTLRELLLSPEREPLDARTQALLMVADRAEHVETVIKPALAAGRHIVTDRFSGSTLAYQGAGSGLSLEAIEALDHFATGGIEPDLTILFDLPVEVARARRDSTREDRYEINGAAFYERVRSGFLDLARSGGAKWAIIDASEQIDAVSDAVDRVVHERFGALTMQ